MCHSFTLRMIVRRSKVMTRRQKKRCLCLKELSGTSRQGGTRTSYPLIFMWSIYPSRSNKNSPKQEIGTAPNTSERHEEKIHVSSTGKDEQETIPVYRASSNEKVVDVIGEEKVWETMGETAPGCPHAHMKVEEDMVNKEEIDEITVEENRVEESGKPAGCPYSHKEL